MGDDDHEGRLVRIETKLDTFIMQGLDDHEKRLRTLERWKYALPASALTALLSAIVVVTTSFKGG